MGARGQQRNVEREIEMVSRYLSGETLEQIGKHYGVTRERVRQLVARHNVSRFEGGACERRRARDAAKAARRVEYYIRRYGMRPEEYEIVPKGIRKSYREQERSAAYRGIGWKFNLAEWISVWQKSGVAFNRGRGKDKYCMSRIDDKGPYSVDNVRVVTNAQNNREYAVAKIEGRRKNTRTICTGVYMMLPGYRKPYMVRNGKRSHYFETSQEAVAFRASISSPAATPSAGLPAPHN